MSQKNILIISILLISIFLAYRSESEETVVENILTEMYTYNYKDYKNVEGHKAFYKLDTVQANKLRNYFTDEGYEMIRLHQLMSRMLKLTNTYHCNSSMDSLEISIQESEDTDVRIGNYNAIIKLELLDDAAETLYFDLSGSMTLYKSGINWEVNYLTTNRRFYQRVRSVLREK